MSYLAPSEFVAKMVEAGESKVFMSTKDTLIRAYMAGADLSLLRPISSFGALASGLPFSIPLMMILLAHELGHYIAARRHGVDSKYFDVV